MLQLVTWDVIHVNLDSLLSLDVVIVTPLVMKLMPSTGHQLVNANVSFNKNHDISSVISICGHLQ